MICASEDVFEVINDFATRVVIVKLDSRCCECGMWQVSGIPYKQSMACINSRRSDPTISVDRRLTKETYMHNCANMVHSIPDERTWLDIDADKLFSQKNGRKLGKPKVLIRREILSQ